MRCVVYLSQKLPAMSRVSLRENASPPTDEWPYNLRIPSLCQGIGEAIVTIPASGLESRNCTSTGARSVTRYTARSGRSCQRCLLRGFHVAALAVRPPLLVADARRPGRARPRLGGEHHGAATCWASPSTTCARASSNEKLLLFAGLTIGIQAAGQRASVHNARSSSAAPPARWNTTCGTTCMHIIQRLDQKFFHENQTGDLLARVSNDVTTVREIPGPRPDGPVPVDPAVHSPGL